MTQNPPASRDIAVQSQRMTLQPAVAAPGRVGQGTVIEQARVVAEVQAMIVVAQNFPRNLSRALADMRDSCGREEFAKRAFFRYKRAGKPITGPSVHLARELMRCWGNSQYGTTELRRDDEHGQSEMQAWAWDMQTNTRVVTTAIVPHKRDAEDGGKILTSNRDIFENNQANAARRMREAILDELPQWYVEEAIALCNKTLVDGGGVPMPKRIADAIARFAELGVTVGQLESKLDNPSDDWTPFDVAQLGVIYQSIRNGETTRADEFPSERASGADAVARTPARTGGKAGEDTRPDAAKDPAKGGRAVARHQDADPPADPPTDPNADGFWSPEA